MVWSDLLVAGFGYDLEFALPLFDLQVVNYQSTYICWKIINSANYLHEYNSEEGYMFLICDNMDFTAGSL